MVGQTLNRGLLESAKLATVQQPSNRGRRYCELQILFDAAAGASHYRRYSADDSDTLPWQEILALTNLLLEEKVADVEGLRGRLKRKEGGVEAALFRIEIGAAAHGTVALAGAGAGAGAAAGAGARAARQQGAEGSTEGAIATLAGDASVSAHYRLGVGVSSHCQLPSRSSQCRRSSDWSSS